MNITINPQLSSCASLQAKKNVKFGNHNCNLNFGVEGRSVSGIKNASKKVMPSLKVLSVLAGVGLFFGSISALVKHSCDSTVKDRLNSILYQQMVSSDGEGGLVITEHEKEVAENVLNFYDENCDKSIWATKAGDNVSFLDLIVNATDNNSDEGMNISDSEKSNIEYRMNTIR